MILTTEQWQAIQSGKAVSVKIDETECVLIRKDLFAKRFEPTSEFDVRQAYVLMDAVARKEGWDDPREDIYDDLDSRKS